MGDAGARVGAEEKRNHDFHDHSGGGHERRMSRARETSSSVTGLLNGKLAQKSLYRSQDLANCYLS